MSGQKLRLLKFPNTTDDIISERIHSLNKLICESEDDAHVNAIIQMLIEHISSNFEGVYIEATVAKLIEAVAWWTECYDPNVTLSTYQETED